MRFVGRDQRAGGGCRGQEGRRRRSTEGDVRWEVPSRINTWGKLENGTIGSHVLLGFPALTGPAQSAYWVPTGSLRLPIARPFPIYNSLPTIASR